LLVALVVLAVLVAGGWYLYQTTQAHEGSTRVVSSTTTAHARPVLTAKNDTHFVLTISMKGPQSMRLQVAPGHSETKTLLPGTYDVEGSLSDSNTDSFKGSWDLKENGTYNVPFRRSEGSGGQTGGLIAAHP
jgi:hypothetical protein